MDILDFLSLYTIVYDRVSALLGLIFHDYDVFFSLFYKKGVKNCYSGVIL